MERNALDDAALAVDGCHGTQVGCAALDGAILHRAAGNHLVVDSRDAARLAVFAGDPGACGGILNGAIVFTRNAARKVRCGVDGALIAAALYRAFVLACRAARILTRCAHRQGAFGFGVGNFGILGVMARQAARVVGRLYTAADGSGLQRADVFARKAARIVACGGDGGVQGSDSFDRAVVCAHGTADLGHAAHGGAAVQPADRARVDARHTADILSAVDGCILGQAVLDAARVDARNAADAFILTLHGAQVAVQCAVLYRAQVKTGNAAHQACVENTRVVTAVLQYGACARIADDAARHVAVYRDAAFSIGSLQAAAAAQNALVHAVGRTVLGIIHRKLGVVVVVADHAAHIGIGGDVDGVVAAAQRHSGSSLFCARARRYRCDIVVHRDRGQQGQCAGTDVLLIGLGRNDAVIADDAPRQRLGLQAVAAAVGAKTRHRHRGGGQIGAHHAAHAVLAGDQLRLDGHGRQACGAVHARQTACGIARRDNAAAHGKGRVVLQRKLGAVVVKADHAAHKAAAVQQYADSGGLCPCDFAHIIARNAAHKVGIAAVGHGGQQSHAACVGGRVGGNRRRAVGQCAGVQADNAAHIGRAIAKGGGHAGVGHVADLAVLAVDRRHAAHIAVAEHMAVVGATVAPHGPA